MHCVLDVRGGPSRRVGPGGVLIGRQSDCDIVVADPSVSRRHALVRLTGSGAEVVPLGRSPVDVNGAPTDRPRSLVDGDELRLPGLTLAVAITIPRPEALARAAFALERSERGGGDPDGSAGGAGGKVPRGIDQPRCRMTLPPLQVRIRWITMRPFANARADARSTRGAR